MKNQRDNIFNTLLIGFGNIAQGLSEDSIYGKTFKFSTHAEALKAHDTINWNYLIEPNKMLQKKATNKWVIKNVYESIDAFKEKELIDIIVFAEPVNDQRLHIIKQFNNLKGIVFEKPVTNDYKTELEISDYCVKNEILSAVNYSRRYSKSIQNIKLQLKELIGQFQCGFSIYCNGYRNNASHLIDLIIYFFGEIISVRSLPNEKSYNSFEIFLDKNKSISFKEIDNNYYRENMIDLWGSKGRLSLVQESSICLLYQLKKNRLISGQKELENDNPSLLKIDLGDSLYNLYNNLTFSINNGQNKLLCSLDESLKTTLVMRGIEESKKNNYSKVILNEL